MNKKLVLALAAVFAFSAYNAGFAADDEISAKAAPDFKKPPVNGEFKGHHPGRMHKFHPSKEEMEKKKAEFEKRLKLTDEQKKQIEENRQLGHEKVKPVFEEKKLKMQELKKIYDDSSLTQEQKTEKAAPIKAELKQLHEKADALRKENMKSFEALLTDEQKQEFAKIKAEQKQEMEKRRAEFEKNAPKHFKKGRRPDKFIPEHFEK